MNWSALAVYAAQCFATLPGTTPGTILVTVSGGPYDGLSAECPQTNISPCGWAGAAPGGSNIIMVGYNIATGILVQFTAGGDTGSLANPAGIGNQFDGSAARDIPLASGGVAHISPNG